MNINLKYTVCFLTKNSNVLLLKRVKPPWDYHWNGVGGKLEAGEDPLESAYREIQEEVGYLPTQIPNLRFGGIVTWGFDNKQTGTIEGMYVFLGEVVSEVNTEESKEIIEGTIEWKPLSFVADRTNPELAHNIPYFLPPMFGEETPARYHCVFKDDTLQRVDQLALPESIDTPAPSLIFQKMI